MDFIIKLKNYKMKFKEKFSNSWYRQLMRLSRIFCRYPARSIKNGINNQEKRPFVYWFNVVPQSLFLYFDLSY